MVDEQIKIAGIQLSCGHEPKTDEDKWNNPQDCFCEECHMMCCRTCFETLHALEHKTHINDFTDEEWQAHVESIKGSTNDFSPDAPKPSEIITAILSDDELLQVLQDRGLSDIQAQSELEQSKKDQLRFSGNVSKDEQKKVTEKKKVK